eukprot:Nk52_evm73s164 gene=Nk52_evmTU73s164
MRRIAFFIALLVTLLGRENATDVYKLTAVQPGPDSSVLMLRDRSMFLSFVVDVINDKTDGVLDDQFIDFQLSLKKISSSDCNVRTSCSAVYFESTGANPPTAIMGDYCGITFASQSLFANGIPLTASQVFFPDSRVPPSSFSLLSSINDMCKGLLRFLDSKGWDHFLVITDMSLESFAYLSELVKETQGNYTIEQTITVNPAYSPEHNFELLKRIISASRSKIIIAMLYSLEDFNNIIEAANRLDLFSGAYAVIGLGWRLPVTPEPLNSAINMMMTGTFNVRPTVRGKTALHSTLSQLWKQSDPVKYPVYGLDEKNELHPYFSALVDEVLLIAYSIDNVRKANLNVNSSTVTAAMRNIEYPGMESTVKFQDGKRVNKDAIGIYEYWNSTSATYLQNIFGYPLLTSPQSRYVPQPQSNWIELGQWDSETASYIENVSPLWKTSKPLDGSCPSDCSAKGRCNYEQGTCSCFAGFKGPTCSETDISSVNVKEFKNGLFPCYPGIAVFHFVAQKGFQKYSVSLQADIDFSRNNILLGLHVYKGSDSSTILNDYLNGYTLTSDLFQGSISEANIQTFSFSSSYVNETSTIAIVPRSMTCPDKYYSLSVDEEENTDRCSLLEEIGEYYHRKQDVQIREDPVSGTLMKIILTLSFLNIVIASYKTIITSRILTRKQEPLQTIDRNGPNALHIVEIFLSFVQMLSITFEIDEVWLSRYAAFVDAVGIQSKTNLFYPYYSILTFFTFMWCLYALFYLSGFMIEKIQRSRFGRSFVHLSVVFVPFYALLGILPYSRLMMNSVRCWYVENVGAYMSVEGLCEEPCYSSSYWAFNSFGFLLLGLYLHLAIRTSYSWQFLDENLQVRQAPMYYIVIVVSGVLALALSVFRFSDKQFLFSMCLVLIIRMSYIHICQPSNVQWVNTFENILWGICLFSAFSLLVIVYEPNSKDLMAIIYGIFILSIILFTTIYVFIFRDVPLTKPKPDAGTKFTASERSLRDETHSNSIIVLKKSDFKSTFDMSNSRPKYSPIATLPLGYFREYCISRFGQSIGTDIGSELDIFGKRNNLTALDAYWLGYFIDESSELLVQLRKSCGDDQEMFFDFLTDVLKLCASNPDDTLTSAQQSMRSILSWIEKSLLKMTALVEQKEEAMAPTGVKRAEGVLDHFWNLASNEQEVRSQAALSLVVSLQGSQKSYEAEEEKHEEGEMCPDIAYALKRLVRGLSSSRDSARQGFCQALCELLVVFKDILDCEDVYSAINESIEISGGMKGVEQKDAYFGRIFGLLAIINSGLISSKGANEDCVKNVAKDLFTYAGKKSYLVEVCYQGLICMLDFCESGEQLQSVFLPLIEEHSFSKPTWTVDDLWLAISVQNKFPDVNFSSSFSGFRSSNLLSVENMKDLGNLLKESSYCHPKIHSIWSLFADKICQQGKMLNSDEVLLLREFWTVVIDGMLMVSSNERQFLGFGIFELFVSEINPEHVSILLSDNILKKLINCYSHKESKRPGIESVAYLSKCGRKVMKLLFDVVEKSNNSRLSIAVVSKFLGSKTNAIRNMPVFKDSLTKMMSGLSKEGVDEYFTYLMNVYVEPNKVFDLGEESSTSEANCFEQHRRWCLDQAVSLLKNENVPATDESKMKLAKFLLFNSYFTVESAKKVKSDKIIVQCAAISPKLNEKEVNYCKEKLNTVLSEFTGASNSSKHAKDGQETSSPNGKNLYETVIFAHDVAGKKGIKTNSSESAEVTELRKVAFSYIKKCKDDKSDKQKQGFMLLFSHMYFQVLNGESEAADLLSEIASCYDSVYGEKEETDEDEPAFIEVLSEILLTFLSKESHLLKVVVENVFTMFASEMTLKALKSLTEVISSANDKEAHDNLFEMEEDVSEEEEEEDEEEIGSSDKEEQLKDTSDSDSEEELVWSGDEAEEEDSAVDSDDEEVDPIFREKVKKALGSALGKFDDTENPADEDESEDEMDDDAMMQIDEMLSSVFKEQSQLGKKNEEKERKQQLIHFKIRAASMLDIYLKGMKKSDKNPQVIFAILPLLKAIKTNKSEKTGSALATKCQRILNTHFGKTSQFVRASENAVKEYLSVESVGSILDALFEWLPKETDKEMSKMIQVGILFVIGICLRGVSGEGQVSESVLDLEKVAKHFHTMSMDYFGRKNSNLDIELFSMAINKYSLLMKCVITSVSEGISSAYNTFRAAQGCEVCCKALNNKAFASTLPQSFFDSLMKSCAISLSKIASSSSAKPTQIKTVMKCIRRGCEVSKFAPEGMQAVYENIKTVKGASGYEKQINAIKTLLQSKPEREENDIKTPKAKKTKTPKKRKEPSSGSKSVSKKKKTSK